MLRLLLILTVSVIYAQTPTEQSILQEAKRRNIQTVEQALNELDRNGIDENQARILARQQGISFDEFLKTNFSAGSQPTVATTTDPDTSILLPDSTSDQVEVIIQNKMPEEAPKSNPKYFGYSIFDKNPFLEKEYLLGNIDESYLVAPGDVLRIIVFGNNSLELEAVVDRNGNINIPNYGVFFAAGNTFMTLKKRLRTYLGKYFSGLLTTPQNTFLDVSLTQLKPTKIVVVGQVNAPGPQILTTQANPLAALYSAGGVKTSGSLREVRVYRNNKLLKTIDLYDYIVSGTLTSDITLTNNDVVFVPPRVSTILLEGEVKKEGYYELKSGEDLSDLMRFSGGLPVSAARDRVNVLRIDPAKDVSDNSDKTLLTINYSSLVLEKKSFDLFDGDQVEVFPLLDRVANLVSIRGNVYNPGTYSRNQYGDLKSLIVNAARGVKEDTYFDKVDVKGIILPSGKETFNTYNLADVLSGAVYVALDDRDDIIVYSNLKVQGDLVVYISGYGVKNSSPVLWRENLSLYDLVFENTAFNSLAFRKNLFESRIDIKSYDYNARRYTTQPYDFTDLAVLKEVYLQPFDRVLLFNKNIVDKNEETVTVSGYVNSPGSFELEKNMYVEDAILLAGGFSDLADQGIVYVNKEELDPETKITSTKYTVVIDMDYINGVKEVPSEGFVLGSKDIVTVRKDVAFEKQQIINVVGEVLYPRTVVAESKQVTLNYLLLEVGGLTDMALLENSYALREGKVLSVDLSKINRNEAIFQDGDQLVISKNFGSVNTEGALANPSIFNWEKGKRAKYYITNSGGKLAKRGGSAYVELNNGKTYRIGFLRNPRVFPNSKIVVDYKEKKENQDKRFFETFSNVFGTVSGALTTILLIGRL